MPVLNNNSLIAEAFTRSEKAAIITSTQLKNVIKKPVIWKTTDAKHKITDLSIRRNQLFCQSMKIWKILAWKGHKKHMLHVFTLPKNILNTKKWEVNNCIFNIAFLYHIRHILAIKCSFLEKLF